MSHFYGTLKGTRGEATRCGSKDSGIVAHAASWEGAVCARVFHDEETGKDWAYVGLTSWHGRGSERELYRGPVDGSTPPLPDDITRMILPVVDETVNKAKKKDGSVTVTIPEAAYNEIRERIIKKVVNCA
jgi:hypothetical protein